MAKVRYYYSGRKIFCEVMIVNDNKDESTQWMDILDMIDIIKEMKREQKKYLKGKIND